MDPVSFAILFAVLGVVAVVILAASIAFLISKRRHEKEQVKEQVSSYYENYENTANTEPYTLKQFWRDLKALLPQNNAFLTPEREFTLQKKLFKTVSTNPDTGSIIKESKIRDFQLSDNIFFTGIFTQGHIQKPELPKLKEKKEAVMSDPNSFAENPEIIVISAVSKPEELI